MYPTLGPAVGRGGRALRLAREVKPVNDPTERIVEIRPRRFRRYPEYKDAGVEWLEQIPAHWEIERLGLAVSGCQNGVWGEEADGTYITVCVRVADFDRVQFRVSLDRPTMRSIEPRKFETHRLEKEDLLLEKSGGGEKQPVGAVVIYEHGECAVCSNFVARMPVANGYHPRYLVYLHAALYAAGINTRSIKQSIGIQNLDSTSYLNESVGFPKEREQRTIAEFLDRETAKIDGLVARKERLIELLQEKRTALITRAVTRGLDPKAPMKVSGVEWLGEIPTHWEVRPLKSISDLQTGLTLGKIYKTEAMTTRPYLRVANVQDGYLALDDIAEVEVPVREVSRFELQAGDVLMTEGGDFDKLGRGHVWNEQLAQCLHQNHIFAVRPRRDALTSHFLALVMSSAYGRAYFTATSKQSTNLASTNSTKLRNLAVPLPGLDDQVVITRWTVHETAKIDSLIGKVRQAINHLKEFRTALISAAVTGKIDVRGEVS